MSAILIDDLVVAPAGQWHYRRGSGVPHLQLVEESQVSVAKPPASLRLTDRGIKVVVSGFLGLLVVAAMVLVSAFFAVPEAPIGAEPQAVSQSAAVLG